MNSCILMAEIVQEPELRYTSDTQTPISEMIVQFPGLRPEDPPATLKVVGWGNLAQDIQGHYHVGDRVILEGRLGMNTIDRPEGFKEKRAELTVQRIYTVAIDGSLTVSPAPSMISEAAGTYREMATPVATTKPTPQPKGVTQSEPNLDEIPF